MSSPHKDASHTHPQASQPPTFPLETSASEGVTVPPTALPPQGHESATIPPSTPQTPQPDNSEVQTLAPQSEGSRPVSESEGVSVPGYEILGELGRGGMGVVYRARHLGLNRVVALKMILSGAHAGSDDVLRFLSEAEAVARFQHPHIVQVFEVNQHNKLPFMALEFVEGGSLADLLKQGPLPPKKAALLVEQMAHGMNAAHQAGIVHRDLKPDNVLITVDGVPKITDFGLAKKVEGGSGLTQTGAILGTPSYMAPEQASGEGKRVGPSADVYALGAVLYVCLTGRPPFQASTSLDTVLQVLGDEPKPPTQLKRGIPRDLEVICLKCLHKEPHRRYSSAEALAQDLRRWQDDEPIKARPVGKTERLIKWVKRRPALAGLMVAAVMFLLLVGIGGPLMAWKQANLREEAESASRLANLRAKAEARAKKKAQDEAKRAEQATKRAEEELLRPEWQIYLGNLREAQLALDVGDFGTASDRLDACRWDFRGWEHDHLFTRLHQGQVTLYGHTGMVTSVSFSLDGKRIVSGSWDKTVKVWDVITGRIVQTLRGHTGRVNSVSFSPDGKRIVSGSIDKTVKVWDAARGQVLRTLRGHTDAVNSVSFSPDGKRIVSGSEGTTIKVWHASTGRELLTLRGHTGAVRCASFSPDGMRIVSGSKDKTVKVWDAATGRTLLTLRGHTDKVFSVSFSPSGGRILSTGDDRTLKLWDPITGRELLTIRGHTNGIACASFSNDGKRIVSGGYDRTVRTWNASGTQETLALRGCESSVRRVSFTQGGKTIVAQGSEDAKLAWDANTGKLLNTEWDRPIPEQQEALSPDKNRLARIAGFTVIVRPHGRPTSLEQLNRGRLARWAKPDPAWHQQQAEQASKEGNTFAEAFHLHRAAKDRAEATALQEAIHLRKIADGQWWDGEARLEEALAWLKAEQPDRAALAYVQAVLTKGNQPFRMLRILQGHTDWVGCVAFSPDARFLASCTSHWPLKEPGEFWIWDVKTGKRLLTLKGHSQTIPSVAFSPNSERIVSCSFDKSAKVWDVATGKEALTLNGHTSAVSSVGFSPNGERIVTGRWNGNVKVWDAATGKEALSLSGHDRSVLSVAFSPDGKRIATSSDDRIAKLWDAATGKEVLSLSGHDRSVLSVSFSPDGKHIVTGSADQTVKVWDAATGTQALSLNGHTSHVITVCFSPDGKRIATGSRDKTVRFWNVSDIIGSKK